MMLYQIYYEEKQLPKILPFAIPVYNPGLTIFFENKIIAELVSKAESEKIGVCSWKLADKMRKHHLDNLINRKDGDYDVLSLTRNSARHNMLAMANAWHPKFKETITLLWQKLGLKMPGEARNPIYQNAWIGKTTIYKKYVDEFLSPAMTLIENDQELHELMVQPSGYGRLSRSADIKAVSEKLKMSDYPLCPFILERCPSLWLQIHSYKISYL